MKRLFAAAFPAWLALTGAALAQLPSTLRIVVPFPAGGSADILSRLLGEQITRARGISVITDNKPGASAIIGTDAVARAAPDGGTAGIISNSFVINPQLRKLPYDPVTSFDPICRLVDSPLVIVVNSGSPYQKLEELLTAARARPGAMSIGALGPATTQHVALELFKKTAKIDMIFVPFPGGAPAVTSLLGSHIDSVMANYSEVVAQVEAGQLRVLATTSPQRIPALPATPTARELGLDFEMTAWFAMVTTGKTPAPVTAALIDAFSAALKAPDLQPKLAQFQFYPVGVCGAPFAAFLRAQHEAMGPIVKEAGIKLE